MTVPINRIEPIDVVYICSHGRSGSSLVGSVLGLASGQCYVGEVREVWRDGLAENQKCGCGLHFRQCPFWREVFQRAYGGMDSAAAAAALALFADFATLGPSLALYRRLLRPRADPGPLAARAEALARLYAGIRAVSGCRVIVDSSKTLRYAALLEATPGLRLTIVNLIRDPRGIVHSRSRQARNRDGSAKPPAAGFGRYRVLRIVGKWALRNALCGLLIARRGGLRIAYEDFARDQRPLIAAIAGAAEAERVAALLAAGIPASLVQHQVAGNWVRELKIAPSESWRRELPPGISILTALLSWPFRWSRKTG